MFVMNTVVKCTYVYSNCHSIYGVDVYESLMDEYVLILDEWCLYTYATYTWRHKSSTSMNTCRWIILYYVFQFILLQIYIYPIRINKFLLQVYTTAPIQLLLSIPIAYFPFQMATKINLFLTMTFMCACNSSIFF